MLIYFNTIMKSPLGSFHFQILAPPCRTLSVPVLATAICNYILYMCMCMYIGMYVYIYNMDGWMCVCVCVCVEAENRQNYFNFFGSILCFYRDNSNAHCAITFSKWPTCGASTYSSFLPYKKTVLPPSVGGTRWLFFLFVLFIHILEI